jgi:rhamnose transport system permease protein
MRGAFQTVIASRATVSACLLIIVTLINVNLSPYFFTSYNLGNIASNSVEIGLMAMAATLLIVSGEIDLSIASMLALCAAVLGVSASAGVPWGLSVFFALMTGLACGLINGLLVTQLGLSSIIVTIGTLALFRGIAEVMLSDRTITELPQELLGWDQRFLLGTKVTWPQLLLVVTAGLFALILKRSIWGRRIQFIGAAPQVAQFSGVPVVRARLVLFMTSGFVSGIASIIIVSRFQAVRYDIGLGLELIAITAVLIGGTDIRGGRGSIWGTLFALALIGSVRSALRLANIPDQVGLAIIGGLLIVAILIGAFFDNVEAFLTRRSLLHARREIAKKEGDTD